MHTNHFLYILSPLVVQCFPINWLTQWAPVVEQELLTFSEHLRSPPDFSGVRVTRSLVLCVLFFWPLCCLSFFDLRILITHLVSSNSSYIEILSIFEHYREFIRPFELLCFYLVFVIFIYLLLDLLTTVIYMIKLRDILCLVYFILTPYLTHH